MKQHPYLKYLAEDKKIQKMLKHEIVIPKKTSDLALKLVGFHRLSAAFNPSCKDAKLAKLTDDEVIELLTEIKGLGREDVFAVDDLGIQKAMIDMFKLHDLEKKELLIKMKKLSERWSPFRTYACLHMWNFQNFK